MATKKKRKKRRTPAQVRATKKLIAFNKKRRKKKTVNYTAPKKRKKSVAKKPKKYVKRRPNPMAKKKKRKRSYKPRKRTYKRRRNPSVGGSMTDMFVNGAIAGVGALGSLFITKQVSKLLPGAGSSPFVRNLVSLGVAGAVGYAAKKYVGGERGKAIMYGAISSAVVVVLNNAFKLGVLAGESDSLDFLGQDVDDIVDELDYSGISDPLYGIADDFSGSAIDMLGEEEELDDELLGIADEY